MLLIVLVSNKVIFSLLQLKKNTHFSILSIECEENKSIFLFISKLLRSSSGFIPNFLHITLKNPKDVISEVKKGVLGGTSSSNLLSK